MNEPPSTGYVYVLMSIGPVQSYISQARRTQDLWVGSRLLSLMAREAVLAACAVEDVGSVFPDVNDLGDTGLSIPNRFMLVCAEPNAAAAIHAARDAITACWLALSDDVYGYLQQQVIPFSDESGLIWQRQIANFLEIQHVVVPVTDPDDYRTDNKAANQRLAARKLMRNFVQVTEPGWKCSVTGEHEALHNQPSGSAAEADVREFWAAVRAQQRNRALLAEGERLCALSTLKRFAHETPSFAADLTRFPSTSSIAAAAFRAQVVAHWAALSPAVGPFLTALQRCFPDWRDLYFSQSGNYHREAFPFIETRIADDHLDWTQDHELLSRFMSLDGDFLYEEGVQAAPLEEQAGLTKGSLSAERVRDVKAALRDLYQAAENVGGARPSDYLVLLSMDGDHMGQRVEEFYTATEHTEFSHTLAEFARSAVYETVERQAPGRVVYAGGDDLLALVPLAYGLSVANAVQGSFGQQIGGSISAGLAVVHRAHGLQAAIYAAKEAQERAKRQLDGSAFVVEFLRRSGERKVGGAHWTIDGVNGTVNVIAMLQATIEHMANGDLSFQFPYALEDFLYSMVSAISTKQANEQRITLPYMPGDMRIAEFTRVFRRRCSAAFRESPPAETLLESMLIVGQWQKQAQADGQGWVELTTLLRLARFLAQEGETHVAVH